MTTASSTARALFPDWYAASVKKDAPIWVSALDWRDQRTLGALLTLLEDDLDPRWSGSSDDLAVFASAVINGVHRLEQDGTRGDAAEQFHFLRFFLGAKALNHAITRGRSSLAFDWLLCSITERPFENVEPGIPLQVDYQVERLVQFATSRHGFICGSAPASVLSWLGDLYYYSRKYGGLRELADLALPAARRIIGTYIGHGDEQLKVMAIGAGSTLASWAEQGQRAEAGDLARDLARLHDEAELSAEAKKLICMTLATIVGRHTDRTPSEWAKRLLANHADLLVQHDHVHYLIASCSTPAERDAQHGEILARVERFATESAADFGGDRAALCFRELQLFDIIVPHIRHLLERGRCRECVELVAAWFGVPQGRRRSSPVLCAVPGHEHGVLYAVEGTPEVIERDTGAALTRMTVAINRAFDLNIVVRDDHGFEPHRRTGRRGQGPGLAGELLEALEGYYDLGRAEPFLRGIPRCPTGVFQPHAVHTPFQAMTLSRFGETWPMVTSFEQPTTDRAIRKALIWTCGTNLGAYEGRAVEAVFSGAGADCEVHVEEDLTPEQFLRFYRDESFDVIWAQAHGQFDPLEPHRAHIELSADKTQLITLADLVRHPAPGGGRRLLFLNICLGGAVLGTEAPPRLGLGALVAAANQAVISHLWEVSSFAAPLFGVLTAVGLARGEGFFPAFCFATRNLRTDRDTAVRLLRTHLADSGPTGELIKRVERGPFGVDSADVRTWGTPVFYE